MTPLHARVPRDPAKNLAFRRGLYDRLRGDKPAQAAVKAGVAADLLFFVNAFVWQYNPRETGGKEVGPWVTFPAQEDAFLAIDRAIEVQEDLVIEKSREMGASWANVIVFVWRFLSKRNQKLHMISRSEKAVESADPDSLFWKVDFLIDHLPDFLKPATSNTLRQRLFFKNPATNSVITGEASTGRAGVGGRATAMLVDEFSQIKEAYEVLHRTSDTTGCRIFNFTHLGVGTAAYELSRRVDVRKLLLHWSMHPRKNQTLYRFDPEQNRVVFPVPGIPDSDYEYDRSGQPSGGPFPGLRSPWYDKECVRKGSARAVAMDLDINPEGAASQFFDAYTIEQLKRAWVRPPVWRGDFGYDRDTGEFLGLHENPAGPLKLWASPDAWGAFPPRRYGMGADLAAGTGATPSCLTVVTPDGEKIAEYTDAWIEPTDLAPKAIALAKLFRAPEGDGAAFAWECPGPGLVFSKRVIELGYRNVYYRRDDNPALVTTISDRPGWFSSNKSKRLLLENYRAALKDRKFVNRSLEALEECMKFVYTATGTVEHGGITTDNDPSGSRENHGDHVIADALAWMMVEKVYAAPAESPADLPPPPGSLAWRRELAHSRRRESADPWH